jgi:hypothetical protein
MILADGLRRIIYKAISYPYLRPQSRDSQAWSTALDSGSSRAGVRRFKSGSLHGLFLASFMSDLPETGTSFFGIIGEHIFEFPEGFAPAIGSSRAGVRPFKSGSTHRRMH